MPSSWWNNFITSDETGSDKNLLLIFKFINLTSIIGVSALLIFGAVHIIQENKFLGIFELTIAGLAIVNVVALRWTKNTSAAANIILIFMLLTLGLLFITGGIANTGLLWFFTFPPLVFFMKGKKEGPRWIYLLFLLIAIAIPLAQILHIDLSYSATQIRQLVASLLATTLIIYFYQHINEEAEHFVKQKIKENQEITAQLRDEVEHRDQTERSLQKQNESLESIKLAMLNLLEDLKTEKEEVEAAKIKDEAILSSIGEGVIVTDENSNIIAINPVAASILRLNQQKDLGKKYYEVWKVKDKTGKTLNLDERPVNTTYQKKIINAGQYSYIRADGTAIPVFTTTTPVILEGKIIGVINTFRDITKEAAIDRAKTEFVSLASHQLRTPLTAIRWIAETLLSREYGKLNHQQKNFLQQIHASNIRMIKLVNALLNVSRIEMGTLAVQPVPTNLKDLAESVFSELKQDITAKKLKVGKKYQKSLPIINTDPQLMRIVLQNLLTNSIKYTPPGGKINLTIDFSRDKINIIVADNGYGIPTNQQSKIFTKLFRADNIVSKSTEGTGLGLYIIESIIRQSDGKIRFESEENKGTTFYIELPISGMKKKDGAKGLLAEI